jgi:hypothetical protein
MIPTIDEVREAQRHWVIVKTHEVSEKEVEKRDKER